MIVTTNLTGEHFNSQPHKEADCGHRCIVQLVEHFNSQPHKEADTCFRVF